MRTKFLLVWGVMLCLLMVLVAGAGAQDRVIRPNDKVKVTCEEEPSLSRDYTVTRDGFVVMAFIGAVRISGLTEEVAADRIEEELVRQRIVRQATVTVRLLTAETLPVRFSGAVTTPGELPWREGMRLSDVAAFTKPLPTADLERVRIESREGQISTVNFRRFDGNSIAFNPTLRPGDFVFFPLTTRETQVFILGSVQKPGAIEFREGMTLAQAIELAGGIRPEGNPDRVRFTRSGASEQVLSLRGADSGQRLQPGDRVVVEALSRQQIVIVMGGVRTPGSMPFQEGLTLGRAIQIAGGLDDRVRPGKVRLTRRVGERTTTREIDYKRILEGFLGDVVLQPGDRIDVPQPRRRNRESDLLPVLGILILLFGR